MTKENQEHLILQIKYAFLALIVGNGRNCRNCIRSWTTGNFCLSHRPLSISASISSTDGTSDHLVISAFQQSEPERHVTDF